MPYRQDERGQWVWVDAGNLSDTDSRAMYSDSGQRRPRDYSGRIPQTFQNYMQQLFGSGGTKGYIKNQVQGASDAITPYINNMSSSGAASLGARGGLAGGGQDAYKSALTGQKVGALNQAAIGAQNNVANIGQNVLGLAQQKELGLSDLELRKFLAYIRENLGLRGLGLQQQAINDAAPTPFDYMFGRP